MALGGGLGQARDLGDRAKSSRDRARAGRGDGGSAGQRSQGRGGPPDGNGARRARRLRQSESQEELLRDSETIAMTPKDPEPQSAEQIAARQAVVRRQGRGQTILSGRLGEAVGPNISRPRLGG